MNVTVYLGASEGNDPVFSTAAYELGSWIARGGHTLVYGGSKVVEPQFFIDACVQYDNLTQLIITPDMTTRKAKMIELGDAFIAFPGGTGTLEEIAEVASKLSLGHLDAPCIFYNLNGYYDDLEAFFKHMIRCGLSTPERQRRIHFARGLEEIGTLIGA